MPDDLIARLKAAHEAATPAPWVADMESENKRRLIDSFADPNFRRSLANLTGAWGESVRDANAALIILTRNSLPEIIAALEERERMRAVVEAAKVLRADREARYALRMPFAATPDAHAEMARLTREAREHAKALDVALDALEKKGEPRG